MVTELVNEIMNAKDISQLTEVGKKLVEMENGGYKKALVTLYKQRKRELISEQLNQDSVFSNLYFIIAKVKDPDVLKNVGRLIYKLKDVLTKQEINVLFECYERKKEKIGKEETEEGINGFDEIEID
ncbi:MAG: hypothetical protein QXF15_04035 [Candidatus Aenigmatarchaeota archaeon]